MDIRTFLLIRGEGVSRHIDRHHVLILYIQFDPLFGIDQGLLQHIRRHNGGGNGLGSKRIGKAVLYLEAELFILLNDLHELAHEFIPLIL